MLSFDLLYPSEEKRRNERKNSKISDSLLQDLKIQELAENIGLKKEEVEMLCEEINFLPSDREVILFRQTILKDLLKDTDFIESCLDLCSKLRDDIPRRGYNVWESAQIPIHKKLKEYIELLEENYQVLCNTKLKAKGTFESEVLNQIIHFWEEEECQKKLEEIIELLNGLLEAGAASYQVEFGYGQAMRSVTLNHLYPENSYMMKEHGIWKKKVIDAEHLIAAQENPVLQNNIDEIYAKTLVRLCDFAARLNSAIVKPFKSIQNSILYYQIGIRLLCVYQDMQVAYCFPEVMNKQDAGMCFQNLHPVQLLVKYYRQGMLHKTKDIKSNDYSSQNGRIAVITGFNSGGKTVFLQSVGIAQILMQLGFPVPAVSYQASVAPYIGSLFASAEDIRSVHGKLEQELVLIRKMAEQVKRGSLLLWNEILSTTSEKEGSSIMADVIRAFSQTDSHILFVTHLGRLADLAEEGNLLLSKGERVLNYVTEHFMEEDGRIQKTYRIIRGKPEKEIFEKALVEKYLKNESDGIEGEMIWILPNWRPM